MAENEIKQILCEFTKRMTLQSGNFTAYLLPLRIFRLDENSIASVFADVLKLELELSQTIFQKTPTQFLRLRCKSRRTKGSVNSAPIVFIWHSKLLFRPAKRERNTNKFYFDSADWPCS